MSLTDLYPVSSKQFVQEYNPMHIFFWFLIIALVAFTVNSILLLQMKKRHRAHTVPILTVVCTSYLAAALLYLLCVSHGEQITGRTRAASFSIEQQSYQTAEENGTRAYAFYTKEGILFRFDDTSLLTAQVPKLPETVEVYSCQTREGFDWCYLREGTKVCYLLK